MPYLLFLKKQQNLKLPSAANLDCVFGVECKLILVILFQCVRMGTGDQAVRMNVPLHVEDKEANVIL